MAEARRRGIGRATGVIVLSLAAHAAFLAALTATIRPERPAPAPAIEVSLIRPTPPEGARAEPPVPAAALPVQRAVAPPPPFRTPQLTGPAPAETVRVAPAPPAPQPVGPSGPSDDVLGRIGDALSRRTVCAEDGLRRLTPEERARCQERAGAAARDIPPIVTPAEQARRDLRKGGGPRRALSTVRAPGEGPQNNGVIGGLPPMVGGTVSFGKPPKAVEPIDPHTLRGDDDALRPKPRSD